MREVNLPPPQSMQDIANAFTELSNASREDAVLIADSYTVTNFTASRTLNAGTATTAQLAAFVATFIDDLQKRGPNRGS
jgi:hypothetical protein